MSWMRTSSGPAPLRRRVQGSLRFQRRPPGLLLTVTQGLSVTLGMLSSTDATAGVRGTRRAPGLLSQRRIDTLFALPECH